MSQMTVGAKTSQTETANREKKRRLFTNSMTWLRSRVYDGCKPLPTEATGGIKERPLSSSGRPTADDEI